MSVAPPDPADARERRTRGAVRGSLLLALAGGFLAGLVVGGALGAGGLAGAAGGQGASDAGRTGRSVEAAPELAELTGRLQAAEQARDLQLAATSRLRSELLEAHRRIESLADTVGRVTELAGRMGDAPVTISRTSERFGDPRCQGINLALRASGVHELAVVELLSLQDGTARGLLVTDIDGRGVPAAAEHWDRARITLSEGLARFVLERDPDAEIGPDGQPVAMAVERRELPMPEVDPQAWVDAGMPLPQAALTLGRARDALEGLLAHQNLEVVSLGGVRGEELLDLELREVDAAGRTLRLFRAGRVQVQPDGPALLLLDGEVESAGDVRPFWRGSTRIPLPGASYGAWLTDLFG